MLHNEKYDETPLTCCVSLLSFSTMVLFTFMCPSPSCFVQHTCFLSHLHILFITFMFWLPLYVLHHIHLLFAFMCPPSPSCSEGCNNYWLIVSYFLTSQEYFSILEISRLLSTYDYVKCHIFQQVPAEKCNDSI